MTFSMSDQTICPGDHGVHELYNGVMEEFSSQKNFGAIVTPECPNGRQLGELTTHRTTRAEYLHVTIRLRSMTHEFTGQHAPAQHNTFKAQYATSGRGGVVVGFVVGLKGVRKRCLICFIVVSHVL